MPTLLQPHPGRQLADEYADSGVQRLALRPGGEIFHAPGGRACVPWRPVGQRAVALGGVIGPREERPAALQTYLAHCDRRGLRPVLHAWPEAGLAELPVGWTRLRVAREAVVELGSFTLAGKRGRRMRHARNRALRNGLSAELQIVGELSPADRVAIGEALDAWREQRPLPPMAFGIGGLESLDEPDARVALARDRWGRVVAFVSLHPVRHGGGFTGDLLCRHPQAPGGAVDLALVHGLQALRSEGAPWVSLGAVPLAGDSDDWLPGTLLRMARGSSRWYDSEGLWQFKQRYRPRWDDLWLAVPRRRDLPGAALAVLRAHVPGLRLRTALHVAGDAAAGLLLGTQLLGP